MNISQSTLLAILVLAMWILLLIVVFLWPHRYKKFPRWIEIPIIIFEMAITIVATVAFCMFVVS